MIVHPAAQLFPMLSKPQLKELQHDMEVHGMREPVKRWNGMIIDGRNRMEAIKGTVVKPIFQEMEFADESEVIAYIISTNIKRRHLTTSQRMAISAELANLEHGSNQHAAKEEGQICPSSKVTIATAAKQMDVSERGTKQARAVLKASPDLHAKVKAGEMSVNAAHSQIAPPKPKPAPEPSPVVDDPDFAHMEDPPPLIPPASPVKIEPGHRLYIKPEDEDCTDDDETEPEWEPSDEARSVLLTLSAMPKEDFNWILCELGV